MELGRLGDPPCGRTILLPSACLLWMRGRGSFWAGWAMHPGSPGSDFLPGAADGLFRIRMNPEPFFFNSPRVFAGPGSCDSPGWPGLPLSPASSGSGSLSQRGRFFLGSAAAGRFTPEEAAARAGSSAGELLAVVFAGRLPSLTRAGRSTPEAAVGSCCKAERREAPSWQSRTVPFTGMPHSIRCGLSHRATPL